MKILLTGPQGNLGARLIKNSPYDVVGVNREGWNDLGDKLSDGIDVVIHAAYDLKNKISDLPEKIMDANLMTTARLLESIQRYRVPRLIFLSSCAVYGESMKTTEEVPCFPISINGIVKLLNERIIEEYCSKKRIKFEIYRVFNMYGGDDHFSILSHLRNSLKNDTEFQLNNNGLSQRDFIHVEDVAKIILKLIDIHHPYTHLNIGTGVSTRISDIVDIIKMKYPNLKIRNNVMQETEYSRADINKLSKLIEYKFIDIREYVEQNQLII